MDAWVHRPMLVCWRPAKMSGRFPMKMRVQFLGAPLIRFIVSQASGMPINMIVNGLMHLIITGL